MNTFRLPPLPRPQEVPVGGGEASCLHCDYELSTVNFSMAAPSRRPTMSLATLAGGGSLPSSRRQRQQSAPHSPLPAIQLGAHVANWRCPPVFPPTNLAETASPPPIKMDASQRPFRASQPAVVCNVTGRSIYPAPLLHSVLSTSCFTVNCEL